MTMTLTEACQHFADEYRRATKDPDPPAISIHFDSEIYARTNSQSWNVTFRLNDLLVATCRHSVPSPTPEAAVAEAFHVYECCQNYGGFDWKTGLVDDPRLWETGAQYAKEDHEAALKRHPEAGAACGYCHDMITDSGKCRCEENDLRIDLARGR